MNIIILQATRLGDVLQTTPLVRAVRRKHPDAHITLLIRSMGKSIAEANPDIDDYVLYDEDEVFQDLRADDSERLLHAYRVTDRYIRSLRARSYDLAYNCTHSIASAMLLKLMGVPEVVGAHLSDDWQYVLRGAWTTYFYTSVFHREFNDLNLCDITGRFCEDVEPVHELVFDVRDEDREAAVALLAENGLSPDDFLVFFQLGASDEHKRWPEAQFAGLARLLIEHYNAKIVLVGVKDEAPLGDRLLAAAPGLAVPFFGRTSVAQLAALLGMGRLLVTNDTGTMHIAASVHCPTVLVSVGYVHFRETGPYGEGHVAVECRRDHIGRVDLGAQGPSRMGQLVEEGLRIKPAHVFTAAQTVLVLRAGAAPELFADNEELSDVALYRSQFAADGCLQWYPMILRTPTKTDVARMAYRTMWLEHLAAVRDSEKLAEALQALKACHAPCDTEAVTAWTQEHIEAFDELADIAKRGIRSTEELIEHLESHGSMKRAAQMVEALVGIDLEMRLAGDRRQVSKPLVMLARFERDNLEGGDPNWLARRTLRIYQDCFGRARMARNAAENVMRVFVE